VTTWGSISYRVLLCLVVTVITACGGNSTSTEESSPPSGTTLTTTLGLKAFQFSWDNASGATYYQLLEDPNGYSGYTPVASALTSTHYNHTVPLYGRLNARYILAACNEQGCSNSSPLFISGTLEKAIGYFKASNTEKEDHFGSAVALSDDGKTLAVGAMGEDSTAMINGDQTDNSKLSSGAIYVFKNKDGLWQQEAYLKKDSDPGIGGFSLGRNIAISGDGDTIASVVSNTAYVFAKTGNEWTLQDKLPGPSVTGRRGITLSNDGNTLAFSGNVSTYVYARTSGAWKQLTKLAIYSTDVSLSGNGNILAIGYNAHILMYSRQGENWSPNGNIDLPKWVITPSSIALSDDAQTLAVGLPYDASSATGINGDENNTSAFASGSVYVYVNNGGTWSKQAYLKASNSEGDDRFGHAIGLSDDGDRLVIGAYGEDSAAKGLNGSQDNAANPGNSLDGSPGAAYVFTRSNGTWSQQAYIKASNTRSNFSKGQSSAVDGAGFGAQVAISGNGNTIAIGDDYEGSAATGINGDLGNIDANAAGAAYLY
jgi:hypothetical protein